MIQIIKIESPNDKSQICEKILRALPQWFGIESAILDYINDVQTMETWAAIETAASENTVASNRSLNSVISSDSNIVGFISIHKHFSLTAEIHVMGILPANHGQSIGSDLIRSAEEHLSAQGYKFLTVKTLSENRPDKNYDKTRQFYLKYGFTPLEEFKTLWGEHNPCLMMIKTIDLSYYSVIFTSKRSNEDSDGYEKTSLRMIELAKNQKGFIEAESSRDSNGFGITVSYWKSIQDIKIWKAHAEHVIAQEFGRIKWYDSFSTRICRVEKEYFFSRKQSNSQ